MCYSFQGRTKQGPCPDERCDASMIDRGDGLQVPGQGLHALPMIVTEKLEQLLRECFIGLGGLKATMSADRSKPWVWKCLSLALVALASYLGMAGSGLSGSTQSALASPAPVL